MTSPAASPSVSSGSLPSASDNIRGLLGMLTEMQDLQAGMQQLRFSGDSGDDFIAEMENMIEEYNAVEEKFLHSRRQNMLNFESSLDLKGVGLPYNSLSGPQSRAMNRISLDRRRTSSASELAEVDVEGTSPLSSPSPSPSSTPPLSSGGRPRRSSSLLRTGGPDPDLLQAIEDSVTSHPHASSGSHSHSGLNDTGSIGSAGSARSSRGGSFNRKSAFEKWKIPLHVFNAGRQWKSFTEHRMKVSNALDILERLRGDDSEDEVYKAERAELRGALYSLRQRKNPTEDDLQLMKTLEARLRSLTMSESTGSLSPRAQSPRMSLSEKYSPRAGE